jgi:hypothetical protein
MKSKSTLIGIMLIFLFVFSSCSNREVVLQDHHSLPELVEDLSEGWREVQWEGKAYTKFHIDNFLEAGLPVENIVAVDRRNDYQGILLRGECTEKILFTDATIQLPDDNLLLWSAIEVYHTEPKAIQRMNELSSYLKDIDTAHEYLYIHGKSLLILSRHFTEHQAKAYEAAFMSSTMMIFDDNF